MADDTGHEQHDEQRQVHDRFAMPILVPIIVFLFGVLTIYGLSRIYLELDTYHVGDVSMATPLAIGVAIIILVVASYLASRSRVQMWELASIFVVAAALLTGGSIWAAVHEESVEEAHVPTETPGNGPGPGSISVELDEFTVTVDPTSAPAGPATFGIDNVGNIAHQLTVIQTDLAEDALPVDEATFAVDLTGLSVIADSDDVPSGETLELPADLVEGPYVLICNVPSHYESGMHTSFEVGPPPGG
jgi:hypothetical protein